jgi:hypothetical protein
MSKWKDWVVLQQRQRDGSHDVHSFMVPALIWIINWFVIFKHLRRSTYQQIIIQWLLWMLLPFWWCIRIIFWGIDAVMLVQWCGLNPMARTDMGHGWAGVLRLCILRYPELGSTFPFLLRVIWCESDLDLFQFIAPHILTVIHLNP